MSYHEYISCDWCDDRDIYIMAESIEVDGEWFEHVCDYCYDNHIVYCEGCEVHFERSTRNYAYCDEAGELFCEECSLDIHIDAQISGCSCYEELDLRTPEQLHPLASIFS